MKKKTLGALVLTLSSLVMSAACATSKPAPPPQPDPGETWSKAGPSVLTRPASVASVHTARPASR